MADRKRHQPTAFRDLIRRRKRGEKAKKLLDEARNLEDPYYRARAIVKLTGSGALPEKTRDEFIQIAFESARKEKRPWRRGELLNKFLEDIGGWQGAGRDSIREATDTTLGMILDLPDGDGLNKTIEGASRRLECLDLKRLLKRALSNTGFRLDGGRSVIREMPRKCGPDIWSEIKEDILSVEDPLERSKLLGYCMRKMPLNEREMRWEFLEKGFSAALDVEGFKKTEATRYLVDCCRDLEDLARIMKRTTELDTPSLKARMLMKIASMRDRMKDPGGAKDLFEEAEKMIGEVEDEKERALLKLNLGKGLEKLGEKKDARSKVESALEDTPSGGAVERRIASKAEKMGLDVDIKEPEKEKISGGRAVLAIYDAYEGGLKPIHRRMIGKAAPICWSFGLDLALVGFPSGSREKLLDSAVRDTNIGKGGKYINKLRSEGRITLIKQRGERPPDGLKKLGLLIATTSHPDVKKTISMREAVKLSSKHPAGRVCLVMGLGRQGLPGSLLKTADKHLELTGSSVPLETSTAMGVMAERLRSSLDKGE